MHFDVDQRYSLIDVVGRGAYGVVCAARDELAGDGGELVAIKKVRGADACHAERERERASVFVCVPSPADRCVV